MFNNQSKCQKKSTNSKRRESKTKQKHPHTHSHTKNGNNKKFFFHFLHGPISGTLTVIRTLTQFEVSKPHSIYHNLIPRPKWMSASVPIESNMPGKHPRTHTFNNITKPPTHQLTIFKTIHSHHQQNMHFTYLQPNIHIHNHTHIYIC